MSSKFIFPPFKYYTQNFPGLQNKMKPVPDCGEKTYQGRNRLTNVKALVTGGDSGIGRAVAIAFMREGAKVCITYLPEEQQDADYIITMSKNEGNPIIGIPGDLRDEQFCKDIVKSVFKMFGELNCLVNCAGRQIATSGILNISSEQFDDVMRTNVYSLFWLSKEAMRYMKSGSSIINTVSGQAYAPVHYLIDYATTKGAIVSFTKALAQETTRLGIRVNAVSPGPFWTVLQLSGGQLPKELRSFGSDTPIKRPGQPVEISHLYVTLASKECSYTSGQIWGCTGGKYDTP